jgi:hypothetical protein
MMIFEFLKKKICKIVSKMIENNKIEKPKKSKNPRISKTCPKKQKPKNPN